MRIPRWFIARFGGLYNDVWGRRARLGAAAVIFDGAGRVLLVRHSYGLRNWELPGGGRKPNESVDAAVHREVREETGLEVAVERISGIYYEPETDQHHFAFVCTQVDGATPRASSAEILECGYWPLDALPKPISDFTMRRIGDAGSTSPVIGITSIRPRRWIR
jgi:8-oxo-dGTP diphosphatase